MNEMVVRRLLSDVLMDRGRTKKTQQYVDDQIIKGECLCEGCSRSMYEPGAAGGRCSMHIQWVYDEEKNQTDEEKLRIRKKHQAAGTLLGRGELRKIRRRLGVESKRAELATG